MQNIQVPNLTSSLGPRMLLDFQRQKQQQIRVNAEAIETFVLPCNKQNNEVLDFFFSMFIFIFYSTKIVHILFQSKYVEKYKYDELYIFTEYPMDLIGQSLSNLDLLKYHLHQSCHSTVPCVRRYRKKRYLFLTILEPESLKIKCFLIGFR